MNVKSREKKWKGYEEIDLNRVRSYKESGPRSNSTPSLTENMIITRAQAQKFFCRQWVIVTRTVR